MGTQLRLGNALNWRLMPTAPAQHPTSCAYQRNPRIAACPRRPCPRFNAVLHLSTPQTRSGHSATPLGIAAGIGGASQLRCTAANDSLYACLYGASPLSAVATAHSYASSSSSVSSCSGALSASAAGWPAGELAAVPELTQSSGAEAAGESAACADQLTPSSAPRVHWLSPQPLLVFTVPAACE